MGGSYWIYTIDVEPSAHQSAIVPPAAADFVRHWFSHDHISPLNPTDNHLAILSPYLDIPGTTPNLN